MADWMIAQGVTHVAMESTAVFWKPIYNTVEKHYAPFVKELRDRTRRIMESGEGLEKTHCTNLAQSAEAKGRIQ